MAHPGGRPLKFKTVKELEEKMEAYFATTGTKKKNVFNPKTKAYAEVDHFVPATITGLAVFLDTTRETLLDYQERPEFSDAIKRAKSRCEADIEYGALTGMLNPTMAIFSAKNNYNWKDKVEVGGEINSTVKFSDLKEVDGADADKIVGFVLGRIKK